MSDSKTDGGGGRFIVVDGIDGGGKSTQMRRIETVLSQRGRAVVRVRDPGSTPTGDRLRELLLQSDLQMDRRTEALVFMAARSEMVQSIIQPALRRGDDVLCDRYLLSTVVYQSIGGEVSADELWRIGRWAAGGLDPDLTILLDLPASVSIQRVGDQSDRMESRGTEYLEAVRQAYIRQLPHAGGRHTTIDATASVEDVGDQVCRALEMLDGPAEQTTTVVNGG